MKMTECRRLAGLCVCAVAQLAVVAEENPYGFCVHATYCETNALQTRTSELLKKIGVRNFRCDFDWWEAEKTKGVWTWERFDEVVSRAERDGMTILPIIGKPPAWATPIEDHLEGWSNFVYRLVSRYKGRLSVWEAVNEPNHGWPDPGVTNYFRRLKATYEAVKAANPAARLTIGGMAGCPLPYIEELYRLGASRYFDIMNVHPYFHPNPMETSLPSAITGLKNLMGKYGDADKPIWISEIGWSTQKGRTTVGGVLEQGLGLICPEKSDWRVVYVSSIPEEPDDQAVVEMLESVLLPKGSKAFAVKPEELTRCLAAGEADVVVFPFSENFPADAADAVVSFVRTGGVFVDFGGMPLYSAAWVRGADGRLVKAENGSDHGDRLARALHVMPEAPWTDSGLKELSKVRVAPGMEKVKMFYNDEAWRYVSGRRLAEGDRMIPILICDRKDGSEAAVAAVFRYGSDLKGASIICTMPEYYYRSGGEAAQARAYGKTYAAAFQLGVEKVFWYNFRALEWQPGEPEDHFGVYHRDWTPKPAYFAAKAFASMRPSGSRQMRERPWIEGNVYYPQWVRPDGRTAGMFKRE